MVTSLSIVIPALNEELYLPKLLTSIASQDFTGKVQVIVVDGKSEDNTIEVAKEFQKKISELQLLSSTRGTSHQRNVGAAKAKYELLIFLDADMTLPKHFLSHLSHAVHTDERFVGLPVVLPNEMGIFDYVTGSVVYLFIFLVRWSKPIASGMCLITTKANHERIGGFDEKIVYMEDFDYGIRSKNSGARYHFFPTLFLYTSVRRARELGRMRLLFLWLRWYFISVKDGRISDTKKYNYKFGHFNRSSRQSDSI